MVLFNKVAYSRRIEENNSDFQIAQNLFRKRSEAFLNSDINALYDLLNKYLEATSVTRGRFFDMETAKTDDPIVSKLVREMREIQKFNRED